VERIDVVPVGVVPEEILEAMESGIRSALGLAPWRLTASPIPEGSLDPSRRQYAASRFLAEAFVRRGDGASRVIAATEADLFIPMLSFVFGQAQLRGAAAVVSTARLRQEFYGLPPDAALLLGRVGKETLHELGHTFGITHCADSSCAMSLSTTVHQIDVKNGGYCPDCALLLDEGRRRAREERSAPPEVRP